MADGTVCTTEDAFWIRVDTVLPLGLRVSLEAERGRAHVGGVLGTRLDGPCETGIVIAERSLVANAPARAARLLAGTEDVARLDLPPSADVCLRLGRLGVACGDGRLRGDDEARAGTS